MKLDDSLAAVVTGGASGLGEATARALAAQNQFPPVLVHLIRSGEATGNLPVMLERAAWRLQRGEAVSAVAADEGWSSAEVFSRAFRRTYGVPPSQAVDVHFRLPAPNGLHFHPPQSLWLDDPSPAPVPDVTALMIDHDLDDTAHLLARAAELIVPFMAGAYLLAAIWVFATHLPLVPGVLAHIVKQALGLEPVVGGVLCAAVVCALYYGIGLRVDFGLGARDLLLHDQLIHNSAAEGARLLDPSGALRPGIPFCPAEGDAAG